MQVSALQRGAELGKATGPRRARSDLQRRLAGRDSRVEIGRIPGVAETQLERASEGRQAYHPEWIVVPLALRRGFPSSDRGVEIIQRLAVPVPFLQRFREHPFLHNAVFVGSRCGIKPVGHHLDRSVEIC